MVEQQFNQFWQTFFGNFSEDQKQSEGLACWYENSLKNFDKLSRGFGQFYGMGALAEETSRCFKNWENSAADFQQFLSEYISLLSFVPKNQYQKKTDEIELLKKEIAGYKSKFADQLKEVADKQKIIADQKKELTNLKKQISDQKKLTSDHNKAIVEFKNEIDELKVQLKDKKPAKAKATAKKKA
jgi:chromosome segregation ATPase